MRTLALLLALCPTFAFGMDRLAALSMIETGNNDRMIGRAGEISRYQILKSEWRTVTNSVRFTDPETAKQVTLALMDRRVQAFKGVYNRPPTNFEFYGLWNAPGQVLTGKVSRTVAERCRRFSNLCDWSGPPSGVVSSSPVQKAPGQGRS